MTSEQIKKQLVCLKEKEDYVCYTHESATKYKDIIKDLIKELGLKATKEKNWIVIRKNL